MGRIPKDRDTDKPAKPALGCRHELPMSPVIWLMGIFWIGWGLYALIKWLAG